MKKKLLLLGGSHYLLPVIEEAHRLGIHVITCDYLPDNAAHRYSDEYHNVSIIDKDAVLALARELQIDGISSFACDPGVVTAAYVAEKLNLPFAGSYESVSILQDKGRFRAFLSDNGFNAPWSGSYKSVDEALADSGRFTYPAIVKPVDSAGSKGVRRIDSLDELKSAAEHALRFSHGGRFIVEQFLEKQGASSDSDSFSIDGKLVFTSFDDQLFDERAENPYTPAAYCWPSSMPQWAQDELKGELQRLIDLLGLKTALYNIESRLCTDGKTYIMEMSPRGGGNRLSEVLHMATGVNLIRGIVMASVGLEPDCVCDKPYDGLWAEIILHSDENGRFKELWIDPEFENFIVERDLWVSPGDEVERISGANKAVGTLVVRFPDRETLNVRMADMSWCKIVTE